MGFVSTREVGVGVRTHTRGKKKEKRIFT